MHGLYAIVDVASLARARLDVVRFAEAVLAARPAALQLRDKRGTPRDTLHLLRALAARCRAASVPLFANDRLDLALAADCDGVHLGQRDLPVALALAAMERSRPLGLGLSTHDGREMDAALDAAPRARLAYVAAGPVRATTSKPEPDPVIGFEGLERLAARARAAGVPCVAIGGVDLGCAARVAASADAAAVIAALLPSEDAGDEARYAEVTRRAAELHRALGGGDG
jgi:thiamine-phosphate pyrophosphorylase